MLTSIDVTIRKNKLHAIVFLAAMRFKAWQRAVAGDVKAFRQISIYSRRIGALKYELSQP